MGSRTIIVTGAFGVLGTAVARAFAAEGARVALVDVAASAPASLETEFAGSHALFAGVDLTSFAATRDTFVGIATRLREVDALINVAGGFRWQTLADGDVDGWDAMYSLNLRTAVVGCKAVLPLLLERGRGRIVNVGAGAAGRAAAGMGAYAASKAGVQRLTESLAAELRDRSITVNAILPGTIDTPRNRADMPNADHSRWVPAAEIASVIRFLASDDAGSVTGAAIPVFGRGWT